MKKIIYIDMDDVLCDYSTAWNKAKKENPKRKFPQFQKGFFENLTQFENKSSQTADF